ncbi:MAG: dihydropteroate synthase [Brevibacterium aurantiacum]|uniref:dihydropteroate synthase n=1 Tax=Brevibacterium aurantiacum TaxID=273384 RepID=UPI003F8FC0B8
MTDHDPTAEVPASAEENVYSQGPLRLRGSQVPETTADQSLLDSRGPSDWTHEDPWRVLRIQGEFVEGFDSLAKIGPAVSIFGSARDQGRTAVRDTAEPSPHLGGFQLAQARSGGPAIMAVINRTTDSFYESAATAEEAIAAVEGAVQNGAHIVDIGGVRAGRGREISSAEEIDRVCPVIEAVAHSHPDVLISVDTWRHEVAQAACTAGAGLLNDTWAGVDPELASVAAKNDVGIVCSHTGGLAPRTDAHRNRYGLSAGEVVERTLDGVIGLAEAALDAGVAAEKIIIDPTPDFGKNTYQSLRLLRELETFTDTGFRVLLAISRKDFVGEAIGDVAPGERLNGTIAATALAVAKGAAMIRTHDVRATADAIAVTLAITGDAAPKHTVRGLR